MKFRHAIGLGSVWEDDYGDEDAVGIFRWRLIAKQRSKGEVITELEAYSGNGIQLNVPDSSDPPRNDGSKWYDGYYNFVSRIQFSSRDFDCEEAGAYLQEPVEPSEGPTDDADQLDPELTGRQVVVACVSSAKGKAPKFSVKGDVSAGFDTKDGVKAGPKIGFEYEPGSAAQKLMWVTNLLVCPTKGGAPRITVLSSRYSVSDTEYWWGDEVQIEGTESGTVKKHAPMVGIGQVNRQISTENYKKLPIRRTNGVEDVVMARSGGIS